MSVPSQVRRQAEAVAEHFANLNKVDPGQAQADAPNQPTPDEPADQVDLTQAPPAAPPQSNAGNQVDTWEQRYKSLQGMFNAEVPRLTADNRELKAQVAQLQELMSSMTSKSKEPVNQERPKYVTDSDVADYGDSIEVMRRVFREETTALTEKIAELEDQNLSLRASVLPRVEQMATAQATRADQQFWDGLTAQVPDWMQVNANPDFQSWLLELDTMTGRTRQDFLVEAQSNLDANRVAYFFKAWAGGNGAAAEQKPRKSSSELEAQIAPGRSRSGGAPTGGAKTYTPQDIQQFFKDVSHGVYKGRDEERNRIEADIFAAQREGRIK
jgi:hypothetical protein